MHTTLNLIRAKKPCTEGWKKLLTHLNKTTADDEPLSLLTILESNGLDDALWCLRATPDSDSKARMFAVFCARQVQHLNPDPRVKAAIDTAERYVHGEATKEELAAAHDAAAYAAAYDVAAAADVAGAADAAGAARAAADAADAADAVYAAYAAADAAYAAADAAYEASGASGAAANAAYAAARVAAQVAHFKHLFQG